MRMFLIASVAAAAMAAVPASAQQAPRHGGGHGAGHGAGGGQVRGGNWGGWNGGGWNGGGWRGGNRWNGQHWGGGRWGGNIGGYWYGGVRAPGGWNAYRRPFRGWVMPGYWQSPAWAIYDWQGYGLQAPPPGYGWSRYYDDAVLMDQRGYVYDSVGGLDWARGGHPDGPGDERAGGYYQGGDPRCVEVNRKRKGSGVAGALLGGALGAGIGAATGGTGAILLGGGLGALGGQAIDRNSRERSVICDGPGYEGGYAYDGGYAYYAPGVTATATVDFAAPVTTTTTTTTTVTEEWVYPRARARKVVRKWAPRTYAPRPKSKLIRVK